MKVPVTKNLNVRIGTPSLNAPCNSYVESGQDLAIDGLLYKGEPYSGNDVWVKDDAGNFYNTEGIDKGSLKNQILMGINDKWWYKNFNIPELWMKGYSGKGVKIAILDSGISLPHDDLELDPALFMDVTKSKSGMQDKSGHGTHCTGIIKAINKTTGPIGIAFNATVYICKITHDIFQDTADFLLAGLKWAINNHVDIISISQGDPVKFNNSNIQAAIADAYNEGILTVISAGNKEAKKASDHIYYPARFPFTLSVGASDESDQPLPDSLLTGETSLFAPGKEILSTSRNNTYINLSGSSQATPFVAANCALLLEYKRKSNSHFLAKDLKDIVINNSTKTEFGKIIKINHLFI